MLGQQALRCGKLVVWHKKKRKKVKASDLAAASFVEREPENASILVPRHER
jgi:hypothetical protein